MCALLVANPTPKQHILENTKPVYMIEYVMFVPSVKNLLYKNHTGIDMNNNAVEQNTIVTYVKMCSTVISSYEHTGPVTINLKSEAEDDPTLN